MKVCGGPSAQGRRKARVRHAEGKRRTGKRRLYEYMDTISTPYNQFEVVNCKPNSYTSTRTCTRTSNLLAYSGFQYLAVSLMLYP